MSKRRKIPLMLAKGGVSQAEVAAALRASKRDVSACAKALRERGLTFDAVAAMSDAEVDAMLAPPARGPAESAYLPPDMAPLVERKRRNRKLTVKMFWMSICPFEHRLTLRFSTACIAIRHRAQRKRAPRPVRLLASPPRIRVSGAC